MLTRTTSHSARPRAGRVTHGFTLIELLVVIAIIAILTAIIFPVFATIRENSRQKTAMSNMHDIQNGITQFKLDNGRYPEVLFGYVVPGASMDQALAVAEQYNVAAQYFPGVYPEYIKDPLTFTDPNNIASSLSKTTLNAANAGPLTINYLEKDPTDATNQTYKIVPIQTRVDPGVSPTDPNSMIATNYYLADAYDISPEIDTSQTNKLLGSNGDYTKMTFVVRYQTSWTGISPTIAGTYNTSASSAVPSFASNYNRQLRWSNPPADTYVTADTHHVPNSNKVIVLWDSGEAKAMDASQFLGGGVGGSDSASVTNAKFWLVSPTNNSNPGP